MSKKNDKNSFNSYATVALQNSMVSGLPQIVGAVNIPKKIVRTLVFILCIAGFTYQTLTFLNLYWEYHTVVDIQVTTPKETNLPGITLCNQNGIYASKVCEFRKSLCRTFSTDEEKAELCKEQPRYCPNGPPQKNMLFPLDKTLSEMYSQTQGEVQRFLQPFEDFMYSCEGHLLDEDSSSTKCKFPNVVSVRSPSINKHRNVCYTIFSLVGKPDDEPEIVLPIGYLTMKLDANASEYQLNIPAVSIQVEFHDPRGVANPYVSGATLEENKDHTFVLKKMIRKLLPEPYETKCVDYQQKWKDKGGHGPTTETDCIQECMVRASLSSSRCIPDGIIYPSNEAYCTNKIISQSALNDAGKCIRDCGPACWSESYDIKEQEGESGGGRGGEGEGKKKGGLVYLTVRLHNMETTTYTYKPQFENIETFSYVGGYVGMWLGISLVAVFDFVETIVMLLKFTLSGLLFRRRRKKRKFRNSRVQHY